MPALVTATQFNGRMKAGKSRPPLMVCETETGEEVEAVVKFSQASERGIGALVSETVAAMLARDLELPVPEPLLVQIPKPLVATLDDPSLQTIANNSSPIAFGSRLLPAGFSVWPPERAIPKALQQQALEIFAFDAWLMNGDRRPSNPNCQSNGTTFAIFDHELCFVPVLFGKKPWEANGLEFLRANRQSAHLFQSGLETTALTLERLAGAVEAVDGARLDEYFGALPAEWEEDNGVAEFAKKHLDDLRNQIEAAIIEVIRVLI